MSDLSENARQPSRQPLVSVPNVSVGEQEGLVELLGEAFASEGGVRQVAEPHYDVDHGRAVFTLAGEPGGLREGLLAGARLATGSIDLARHAGTHPCVGVLDVAPVVHWGEGQRGAAWVEALAVADTLGHEAGIPVFLYGALAGGRARAELRRGGAEGLAARVAAGELAPDFGPARIDPSTGATLVGARPPLVAFNLELAPPADLELARRISAEIREGGSRGLPGVRAIGISLGAREGIAQVSVNVEDCTQVPLARLVESVAEAAEVSGTELVGLAPRAAFEGFPEDLECRNRATLEDALGF